MDRSRWDRVLSSIRKAFALPDAPTNAPADPPSPGAEPHTSHPSTPNAPPPSTSHPQQTQTDHPTPFATYQFLNLLNQSPTALTYFAKHPSANIHAVVKILRTQTLSATQRDHLAYELRFLTQLNHPSIAHIYNAGTLPDGMSYVVTEFIQGIHITDYCASPQITINDRIRLIRTIAEAVKFAHNQAILHQNLKPSNILVQIDGSVKLLDFVVTKHLANPNTIPNSNSIINISSNPTNEALNTNPPSRSVPPDTTDTTTVATNVPAPPPSSPYTAPEQHTNSATGTYTDIFALGILLRELLASSPYSPTVQPDLLAIIQTATQTNPAARYQSTDAFIRDLNHYLNNEPLDATLISRRQKAAKFARRNKRAVALAAVAATTVITVAASHTVHLSNARDFAINEATQAESVHHLALNLSNSIGDSEGGPTNLHVAGLLEQGLIRAKSLDQSPDAQADLYEMLGDAYTKLGNYDRADSLLHEALNERTALYGPTHPSVIHTLVDLGLLRLKEQRFDDAERYIRDAISRSIPSDNQIQSNVASATTALGQVLEARGDYDDATEAFTQSVAIQKKLKGPTDPSVAAALEELAEAELHHHDFDAAQQHFAEMLAIYKSAYGSNHYLTGIALSDIGTVHLEQKNYAQAESTYRDAIENFSRTLSPNHLNTGVARLQLGRALMAQRRFTEAELEMTAGYRTILSQTHPPHNWVRSARRELANVYDSLGNTQKSEALRTALANDTLAPE